MEMDAFVGRGGVEPLGNGLASPVLSRPVGCDIVVAC